MERCKKHLKYKIRKPTKNIVKIIEKHRQGIRLDIGAGNNPQQGYVAMDIRPLKGIDIVHNAESIPYPLPDECCSTILVSHLVEHICPKRFIDVMNEWWRIMRVGGQLLISMPYGVSYGFVQDPTHCNCLNEASWTYFDPSQFLYQIYRPRPWKVERNAWFETGNMEVILSKISLENADRILKERLK